MQLLYHQCKTTYYLPHQHYFFLIFANAIDGVYDALYFQVLNTAYRSIGWRLICSFVVHRRAVNDDGQ